MTTARRLCACSMSGAARQHPARLQRGDRRSARSTPRSGSRWRAPGLTRLVAADSLRLPFSAETMDCVLALDVIEHVKDDIALCARRTGCSARGVLVLTVPAFMSLWRSMTSSTPLPALLEGRAAGRRARRGLRDRALRVHQVLFYFPLLVRAKLDRARKGTPGRRRFLRHPAWLNTMLRWQIVWSTASVSSDLPSASRSCGWEATAR